MTPRPGAPRVGSMVLSAGVFAGWYTIATDPTCISLMNMMMSSTRGVLVTGEDTCKSDREPSSGRGGGFHRPCSYRLVYPSEAPSARLRTARMFSRVDTQMLASHMHDGHDGRHDLYMWSTQPAKACVSNRVINRVDDAPAWRASRRLDGPSAGVFAG